MAEAPPRPGRFFCHRCSVEIIPRLPDYTCSRCDSGFIEQLPEDRGSENDSSSTASTSDESQPSLEDVDHQHLVAFHSGFDPFTVEFLYENFPGQSAGETPGSEGSGQSDATGLTRLGAQQPQGQRVPRRQARQEGVPTLEGIIQQLVHGIIAPAAMPNIGMGQWGLLHSNPMDYAWGANGLDAIITQVQGVLLNQFENTGPPPADGERIKTLPTITITEEHVGASLECPVCKEDYTVGESVRQLPCNHLFHNNCIVPWLEQHDTCPVCRKSLSGQNTATDPPGLSGMNFSPSSSSSSSSSSGSPSNQNPAGNS